MRNHRKSGALGVAVLVLTVNAIVGSQGSQGSQGSAGSQGAPAASGAALYEANCAQCHTGATDPRIPSLAVLRQRSAPAIVEALTTGQMRAQGETLTVVERAAIAQYLSGSAAAAPSLASDAGRCTTTPAFDVNSLTKAGQWNGWGVDVANTRFQPAEHARLTAAQVPNLKLKWAFGFANGTSARSQPTIVGGRLFVGSQSGDVYALDAKTGCVIWTFKAAAGVRASITLGPKPGGGGEVAYFGDQRATVYAIDAANGTLIWTRKLDTHRSASITGTPTLFQDRLYVPVSSGEEGRGGDAQYECCTFRGSVAALRITTGDIVWQTYTIADAAKPIGKNTSGTTRFGPSGAGVWSAPTVDAKRRVVYAATGNMYTEPAQTTSDAVLAFDMESGRILWSAQALFGDVYVTGCGRAGGANCPQQLGPDFDFGNAPILARLPSGKDAIVIGQKSGVGWAFDPDNKGAVLWQYKAGRGSALGGMEWGSAVDSERAYFAIADGGAAATAGLHAVSLERGERLWHTPPATPKCASGRGCSGALSAAITVIPGVVFAGSMDGGIRAHATSDGSLLWEFDTNREFDTVNGVKASGASINQAGPTVADGMVYVSSGYGSLGGRPGNVLLAFGME